ncbi:anillin, actin binding protein 2 isoform X2 [Genypterus blacodes]|uniref:anillin, actin binding protein 2 isoform X2 n=1 Tax=Genypterus blacodes TaxID=154954 RepID=UPI003F773635
MELEEESGGNVGLKRQRAPLSDSEDNVPSAPEMNDGQKRRRLEATGQENRSPKPSSSGRVAEMEMKPDTPMVPSIRSRVQNLTRRQDGAPLPQRCQSDPGGDAPSPRENAFREHLLSEGEFTQRMERFQTPLLLVSPTPDPAGSNARSLSNFVSGIQQKLQGSTTPSSKQACRMRQEREQELRHLNIQPISENAWLKRSSSDSSLTQADGDAEMKDGSFTESASSRAGRPSVNGTEAELSSHDETNTSEVIDQMFGEVLEYAERLEKERGGDEHDSGIGPCSGDKDKMDTESEKEKSEEEEGGEAREEECDELDGNGDELLTFPPSGILSPLSKSVEAVVTPLRLAARQQSNPPSLLLTPEETSGPPAESAPLYSVDMYRTQRQNKLPTIQSVTPGIQRRAPEKSRAPPSINTKDRITGLNDEAGKLQTVITQTLQALSCCTDEEHGRGSLEEAEAEKLLLVSCEKRSALLAEVVKLREERSAEGEEVAVAAGERGDLVSQQPCRGTVSISRIQLPLKVEFVCSSRNRTGRPSHYFFVLIRYGPYNMVATPLATAADAQSGDTVSFPTSVTLKDIRANFEIDVEVYSLSHTSASSLSTERSATKSRVTPRKLLSTITRSSNSVASAALPVLSPRRSSNFCLVGSHKLSLASLGQSKFPLDKMKLEGKIRRLLGDEFQEKVPFLSPLEGNIYLQLDSQSHSNVQHQGFLTMFDVINGFGVWHRRYFTLEGGHMFYWNHPNDKEAKEAVGSVPLSGSPSQCVKPVKRDSCARPFTFELVNTAPPQQQGDAQDSVTKCWFSADTKQERLDWMEKLNQALLDLHTWSRTPASQAHGRQVKGREPMRESIL